MDKKISTNGNAQSLWPIISVVFIDMLGIGIIIPVIATIFLRPEIGLAPIGMSVETKTFLLGLLTATFPFAQFFGSPILGALSDRHGRKKVLIISLIGTLVGYLLFAMGIYFKNIPLLFIARLIDGFTGGNISTAMSAIADLSSKEEKSKNFGLVGMAFGLGFIFGPYIGGKLSDSSLVSWFNFSTPFYFAAILCTLNLISLIFKFKETLHAKSDIKISAFTGFKNLYRAFRHKNLRTMYCVLLFLVFGFNFFTQFFQVFLIQKFNFTQGQIGDFFAYTGIWIALTQGVLNRFISKKFKPNKILSISILILSLSLIAILIPSNAIGLIFVMPFIAMANGLTGPNASAIISDTADKKSQGEIMGISQSIQSFGMIIPPLIAGIIVNINMNLPILVGSLATLLAWIIFKLFFKQDLTQKFHEK